MLTKTTALHKKTALKVLYNLRNCSIKKAEKKQSSI